MRWSTKRMKLDSLVPPGLSGELRGCGRMVAVEDAMDEGGGEWMKPPPAEWAAIVPMFRAFLDER